MSSARLQWGTILDEAAAGASVRPTMDKPYRGYRAGRTASWAKSPMRESRISKSAYEFYRHRR